MKAFLAAGLLLLAPAAATAQIAALHIKVAEGEGTVLPAGSRSTRTLIVEITDDLGHSVQGAAVSFHLPADGPGGTFTNGLRTDMAITDSLGRAQVRGIQVNRTPGRFEIRITAVKEQARAGMLSFQYVGEARSGSRRASAGRKRWLALGLLLASAAAGGAVATTMGGGGTKTAASTPATVPTPPAAGVTIGPPVISVGRP
jgi:hypothetical protein